MALDAKTSDHFLSGGGLGVLEWGGSGGGGVVVVVVVVCILHTAFINRMEAS